MGLWTEGCHGPRVAMGRGLLWAEGCYGPRLAMSQGLLWVAMGRGLLWAEGCYGPRIALTVYHCFPYSSPVLHSDSGHLVLCPRPYQQRLHLSWHQLHLGHIQDLTLPVS